MDGLLLDTEKIALSAFTEACREYDFEPDVEVYYRCIGTHAAREILSEGYGPDFPCDAVLVLWEEKYRAIITNQPVPLKPGVLDLLQLLERDSVKTAVVTSTKKDLALIKLTNTGLLRYFDFVLGGDQVTRSKPDPEMYLTACQRMGEEPADCLALEDSDNGALAAIRAGLTVIQVPDMVEPSAKVRALGHKIVKSLEEVLGLVE